MEHLAQKEDIQMCPNSMHLLALSEDRNDEVEVFGSRHDHLLVN
jgi:hypothetical protein